MASAWIVIICIICMIGLGCLYVYAWSIPTLQLFGPAVVRGAASANRISLTFDDGPSPACTGQILDILRSHGVKATFFVCGQNVERYPEVLKRIHAEGHGIGNHGYAHRFPYFRAASFFAQEIDRAQRAIESAVGARPRFFRPPFGARWIGMGRVAEQRGLRMVTWSDTGYDWKLGAEGIVRETLKTLRPGSIILLHDGCGVSASEEVDRSETVRALPVIIDRARKAGFSFVSLEELLSTAEEVRGDASKGSEPGGSDRI